MIVKALNTILVEKFPGIKWEEHEDGESKSYTPVLREEELLLQKELLATVLRNLYEGPELTEQEKEAAAEARSFLSPSRAGGCYMRAILDKLGCPPEPLSVRAKLTFMFGDMLEALYRYLLRNSKFEGFSFIETPELQTVIVGDEEQRAYYDGIIEVDIDILSEYVGGSDDFWADLKKKLGKDRVRILFEMKTKSDWGFKDLQKSGKMGYRWQGRGKDRELVWEDHFGYRSQMGYYLRQAHKDGAIDIPLGVWFVVNKNTGSTLENFVALKQLTGDMGKSETNYQHIVEVVRNNKKLPERPYKLQEDGSIPNFPCGYCSQKWSCWSDAPVREFTVKDSSTDSTFFEPVYEENPTTWLEVDFDKGKPKFFQMEKAVGDE